MSSSARTAYRNETRIFLRVVYIRQWSSMKNNVIKMQDIDSSKCGRDLSANKLCIYIYIVLSRGWQHCLWRRGGGEAMGLYGARAGRR